MSLKASSLKSNESQKKSIAKEANSILGHIDEELKLAHDQGKHNVSITLPITFSIPYMSNKDAQRNIYHRVLISLIDREFNVKIALQDSSTIFHITWLSESEQKDIELQNALLAKYCSKKI